MNNKLSIVNPAQNCSRYADVYYVFGHGRDRVLAGSNYGRDCEVCGGYGRGDLGEDGQTNCIPNAINFFCEISIKYNTYLICIIIPLSHIH